MRCETVLCFVFLSDRRNTTLPHDITNATIAKTKPDRPAESNEGLADAANEVPEEEANEVSADEADVPLEDDSGNGDEVDVFDELLAFVLDELLAFEADVVMYDDKGDNKGDGGAVSTFITFSHTFTVASEIGPDT